MSSILYLINRFIDPPDVRAGDITVKKDAEIKGDCVIDGNLTVNGEQTILNVDIMHIEDNEIVLNSNVLSGTPTISAGITVRRGNQTDATLRFNEDVDQWQIDGKRIIDKDYADANYSNSLITDPTFNTMRITDGSTQSSAYINTAILGDSITFYYVEINSTNKRLDVNNAPGVKFTVYLTEGYYTPIALATEIQTKLNSSTFGTWVVLYNGYDNTITFMNSFMFRIIYLAGSLTNILNISATTTLSNSYITDTLILNTDARILRNDDDLYLYTTTGGNLYMSPNTYIETSLHVNTLHLYLNTLFTDSGDLTLTPAGNVIITKTTSMQSATATQLTVDNIRLDGFTLSTTSGNLIITPSNMLIVSTATSLQSATATQLTVDNIRLDDNTLSTTTGNLEINSAGELIIHDSVNFNSNIMTRNNINNKLWEVMNISNTHSVMNLLQSNGTIRVQLSAESGGNSYIMGNLLVGTSSNINNRNLLVNGVSESNTVISGNTFSGNLQITANTISAINTDGSITITPNGSGIITLSSIVSANGHINSYSKGHRIRNVTNNNILYEVIPKISEEAAYVDMAYFGEDGITPINYISGRPTNTSYFSTNLAIGSVLNPGSHRLFVNGTVNINNTTTIGNLQLSGNTLSSTNTNGDISITPNGFGEVNIPTVVNVNQLETSEISIIGNIISCTSASDNLVLTAVSPNIVYVNTPLFVNGSTTSGNLQISSNTISAQNTNGSIILTPNGSGTVQVNSSLLINSPTLDTSSGDYCHCGITSMYTVVSQRGANGRNFWFGPSAMVTNSTDYILYSRNSGNSTPDPDIMVAYSEVNSVQALRTTNLFLANTQDINTSNAVLGINTTSNVTSACVQINSTTKGVLPPRMTGEQKTAISSPAEGLMVYDTDIKAMSFYDGQRWYTPKHTFNTSWETIGSYSSGPSFLSIRNNDTDLNRMYRFMFPFKVCIDKFVICTDDDSTSSGTYTVEFFRPAATGTNYAANLMGTETIALPSTAAGNSTYKNISVPMIYEEGQCMSIRLSNGLAGREVVIIIFGFEM